MRVHFHKELDSLKKRILSLGAMVEDRVRMAIKAIETEDSSLAEKIIEADSEVDETEVEIEEECLKTLALHQPVAVDLRFITAVIKINNDLERIGDEAVNIAQRVVVMAKRDNIDPVFDYSYMAEKAEHMLRKSLDALVNLDLDLALKVCLMDDEVDAMRDEVYDIVKNSLFDNRDYFGYLINLLLISRHLERIADYATNIAEEVIYMVEGEIVRHGKLTPHLKDHHT
ncbi:MAG: phosphate signaling complex protein PhoU [Thermodesulfobacteriota bacterium]|nr:phosphate signaling complex protein PhoU [Thermodesulfobacteriota bacterium]